MKNPEGVDFKSLGVESNTSVFFIFRKPSSCLIALHTKAKRLLFHRFLLFHRCEARISIRPHNSEYVRIDP